MNTTQPCVPRSRDGREHLTWTTTSSVRSSVAEVWAFALVLYPDPAAADVLRNEDVVRHSLAAFRRWSRPGGVVAESLGHDLVGQRRPWVMSRGTSGLVAERRGRFSVVKLKPHSSARVVGRPVGQRRSSSSRCVHDAGSTTSAAVRALGVGLWADAQTWLPETRWTFRWWPAFAGSSSSRTTPTLDGLRRDSRRADAGPEPHGRWPAMPADGQPGAGPPTRRAALRLAG